jgi:integrative and conjugative element protein (TIGR02256 family)
MHVQVKALEYAIEGARNRLVICPTVLDHFEKWRQSGIRSREAGGQLFGTFHETAILINHATGPYSNDRRSRFQFTPCRAQEQSDIVQYFKRGQHFLGNWHTHPEKCPRPSSIDITNMKTRFCCSDHQLLAFTMIIVGTALFPTGLSVILVNADAHTILSSI